MRINLIGIKQALLPVIQEEDPGEDPDQAFF
jgi:hypothetical protein